MWLTSSRSGSTSSSGADESSDAHTGVVVSPCQKAALFVEVLIEECCCSRTLDKGPNSTAPEKVSRSDSSTKNEHSNPNVSSAIVEDEDSKISEPLPTSIYLQGDGSPMQVTTAKNPELFVEKSHLSDALLRAEATTEMTGGNEQQKSTENTDNDGSPGMMGEIVVEEPYFELPPSEIDLPIEKKTENMVDESRREAESPNINNDRDPSSDSKHDRKLPPKKGTENEKSNSNRGQSLARKAFESQNKARDLNRARSPSRRKDNPRESRTSGNLITSQPRSPKTKTNRSPSPDKKPIHKDLKQTKMKRGTKLRASDEARTDELKIRNKSPTRKTKTRGTEKKENTERKKSIPKKSTNNKDVPSDKRRLQRGDDEARTEPPKSKPIKTDSRTTKRNHGGSKEQSGHKGIKHGYTTTKKTHLKHRRDEDAEIRVSTTKPSKNKPAGRRRHVFATI